MSSNDDVRTVYSTATDGKCPVCGWPQRSCACSSNQKRLANAPVPARLVDEAADVGDDRVAFVRPRHDPVLHVDDEECGVRPVLQCGHGSSPRSTGS